MQKEILNDLCTGMNNVCELLSKLEIETCLYQVTPRPVYANSDFSIEEFKKDWEDVSDFIKIVSYNITNANKKLLIDDINEKINNYRAIIDKNKNSEDYYEQKNIKWLEEVKIKILEKFE